jgi:hypothetical protein
MAADLVPIRLSVTTGDLYTVWAPRWRDAADEWEGFLGEGDDLYAFRSTADLVAFVRSGTENDLADHPGWTRLTQASAHRVDPDEQHRFDLVGVEGLLAEQPTEESIQEVANTLAIVSSIGTVCDLPVVSRFFNGNPRLSDVNRGIDEFAGRSGRKRWNDIAAIVGRSWEGVLSAIEDIITTPQVDEGLVATAAEQLAEPEDPEDSEGSDDTGGKVADVEDDTGDRTEQEGTEQDGTGEDTKHDGTRAEHAVTLGDDEDFWHKVGIDPLRLMTSSGRYFTLRCYFDDRPLFLGRNGRISVFPSERALARYLADEHDHDLSELSTYDDVRTAATDGSLDVGVTADNVYVLTGLADDLADGPDAVDREQLGLVVEFLRDVGDYSQEDTVDRALAADKPLGRLVDYLLGDSATRPHAPYADVVTEFEKLERFVESRLRRE